MSCDFNSKARNRITIQSPSDSGDSYGGRTASFSTQSTVWAQITPVSSREMFGQGAIQSKVTHKILIRYQAALKDVKTSSDYRISFDGRFFGVLGIRNLDADMKTEGRFFQELLCEENGADING